MYGDVAPPARPELRRSPGLLMAGTDVRRPVQLLADWARWCMRFGEPGAKKAAGGPRRVSFAKTPEVKEIAAAEGSRASAAPEERLPPYAIVVTVPLVDVSPEMGPSEVCVGHKLRFYRGWRCDDHSVVAAATTKGTVTAFDDKTLHRGRG